MVGYIDGLMHVCCSEFNGVSNECNEPTSYLVQPIGTHGSHMVILVHLWMRVVDVTEMFVLLFCVTCVYAERV